MSTSRAPGDAGERIRAARNLIGVKQTQLAASLGLAQSAISQYESGMLPVTYDLLDRIAEATGLPRAFFNETPTDLPPVSLRFRKQARASATESAQATQLVTETYRMVWTLVNERAGFIPPPLPQATERNLSGDQIEEYATQTRSALGLAAEGPVMHVIRALERRGVFVAALGAYGSEDGTEAIGHFGASCWPGSPEPALVGYFPTGTGDRQRFTLAHELGHLVLHSRRTSIADAEAEAHRFAGAFLISSAAMAEFVGSTGEPTLRDYATLKATWGVSIQALILRATELGLIDAERKTSLFKQLSARGWRRQEPVTVHGEEPVLLGKLLEQRFGSGRSAYSQAAAMLGLPAFTIAQLAPRVP